MLARLTGDTAGPLTAAGKSGGSKWATAFGIAAKGAMAGLGAAVAGVAGLAKLGESFDGAFDTIRTGTGATGKSLERLQDDFKTVFSSVPVSMGDASTAIADLNKRLGLSGKPLQRISTQMLNLSRVTGTDVAGNVANITRVFGDWGVSTKDQSAAMDQLFRASQSTGAGVDQLSQGVVKFGAPLRQLGFGFEESLAMLGKFEKEGVNTELVVGSMRIALGKLARSGEPAQETFRRVSEEIKNAGSTSEANALALELFGARAGPDMAAAIREGRFEIDELTKTIASGGDTINGVAGETDDWREKLRTLGNKAMVALEPLATKVFTAIGTAIEWATPYVEKMAIWLGENLPKAAAAASAWFTQNLLPVLAQVVSFIQGNWRAAFDAVVGFFSSAFEGGKMMVEALADAFGTNQGTILKVLGAIALGLGAVAVAWNLGPGLIITGVILVAAALLYAYKRFSWFRTGVNAVFKAIAVVSEKVIEGMSWAITHVFVPAARWIWAALQQAWVKAQPILQKVWSFVKWVVDKVVWYFTEIWWPAVQLLWSAIKLAWDLARPVLRKVWSAVQTGIDVVKAAIDNVFAPAWEAFSGAIQTAWDAVRPIIETIMGAIGGLITKTQEAIDKLSELVNGKVIGRDFANYPLPEGVPEFHSGGVVPGRAGQEVPAVLMAGERVLTAAQWGRLQGQSMDAAPGIGRVDAGVHIGQIAVADGRDLVSELDSIEWKRRSVPRAWQPVMK
jgi:phage-related minor tail protein